LPYMGIFGEGTQYVTSGNNNRALYKYLLEKLQIY
jgi:hypothetical protein